MHVLDALARQPRPEDVEVVLLTPVPRQLYSGMLPGWVSGRYPIEACAVQLDHLAGRAGVTVMLDEVVGVVAADKVVRCRSGRELEYDWLSLDVGSVTAQAAISGTDVLPVRPIEGLVAGLGERLDPDRQSAPPRILIAGAGAAGVELAFALSLRCRRGWPAHGPASSIVLLGSEPAPLSGLPGCVRAGAARRLAQRGVKWIGGRRVQAVGQGLVRLDDGDEIAADLVLMATGAAAPPWLAATGLPVDQDGFLRVTPTLQSVADPSVFAAGDCAAYAQSRPKSGVFAVRAGPPLAFNLLQVMQHKPLRHWRPQRRALYLISTGDDHAFGAWGGLGWSGRWVWRWKDRIDRAFIARFGQIH